MSVKPSPIWAKAIFLLEKYKPADVSCRYIANNAIEPVNADIGPDTPVFVVPNWVLFLYALCTVDDILLSVYKPNYVELAAVALPVL